MIAERTAGDYWSVYVQNVGSHYFMVLVKNINLFAHFEFGIRSSDVMQKFVCCIL